MFFVRQIKKKTDSNAERKKALSREVDPKKDNNNVPTSCDDYIDESLKEWHDNTDLQLSFNKNRLQNSGSNFVI